MTVNFGRTHQKAQETYAPHAKFSFTMEAAHGGLPMESATRQSVSILVLACVTDVVTVIFCKNN